METPPVPSPIDRWISRLRHRAAQRQRRIVYPESRDPRILQAASIVARQRLATPVLVGEAAEVETRARELGIGLSGVEFASPSDVRHLDRYTAALLTQWRSRGVTELEARARLSDPMYFGAAMVHCGDADGFVGGAATTTADTVRAAIRCIGLRDGSPIVSSFFLMVLPATDYGEEGALIYADCAVVPAPAVSELAAIAVDAARNARIFLAAEPKVAFLAFSTKGSAENPSLDKIREAVEMVRVRVPGLAVDGELQVDAALVAEVARSKAPGSPIRGMANTLIFPDLHSGNIAYKLTERLARARAIGPILQGLKRPANDLSRGCSVEDVIDVTAVTSLQAES